jgi:N-acetylglucosamine kinase-like BadF-type ATPase
MPWVLGLDGGGSKTVALIANEKGRVLGRGESGPATQHTAGLARAAEAIRTATYQALDDAGLLVQAIQAACFALAGADQQIDRQVMASVIAGLGLKCPIQLEHDATAALAGATGGRPGVIIIADTGAIAYGEDGTGQRARADGYGPILGDAGSGYDVGRRALIAALRHEDGRGPATVLTERIRQRFMLGSMTDLINLVHGNPAPLQRQDIAALAPLVTGCALEGDRVARDLIKQAGQELGITASAVLQRLTWPAGQTIPVAGTGSMFDAGPLLIDPMEQVIRANVPQAELVKSKHTPAYGAVLLALRSLGIQLEDEPGERRSGA